jgi:uncharacterized metal-binding protein
MGIISLGVESGTCNPSTKEALMIIQAFPKNYRRYLAVPVLGPLMDQYAAWLFKQQYTHRSTRYELRKPREKLSWTRVDEIMEYARIRGMTRLGIATCGELMPGSKLLSDILESNGFEVVSVICLCGEINPPDVGMPGNKICNPIMQAEVLNREKTELNMMVGLCLGHDILFLRYCKAETTPLIVKDRALGHNPVASLYLSQNPLYKDRFIRK